ncbi:MAG: hypothetical protein ACRYG7_10360 [Janthinobacterium lividum]
MKKLLFLGACLMVLASQPVMAQTGEPDVVIMEVSYASFSTLRIVTSHGEGKTETVEVKNKGNDQVEAVQKAITALYRAGYSLRGTYGPGTGSQSSFIFVKGQ